MSIQSESKRKRKPRPKIDEVANKLLSGEKSERFWEFIDFLGENKLRPSGQSDHVWSVNYKGIKLFNIGVWENHWRISDICHCRKFNFFEKAEKYITDEELKQFILDNVSLPSGLRGGNCGMCMGTANVPIFGRIFEAICHCTPIGMRNPEGKLMEHTKELILVSKRVVEDVVAEEKQSIN